MKKPLRDPTSGTYTINGKEYLQLIGSRQQVMNQTAYRTSGNFKVNDLIMNKHGRIVSAKKHRTAKKDKRLEKAGYVSKKGMFGYVKTRTPSKSITMKTRDSTKNEYIEYNNMKRPVRDPTSGTYTINGKEYPELFGSRQQVMNQTAYKTPGGLTVNDLIMNKHGRIVSRNKYESSRKENRLAKYGYTAKKGKFGYVKTRTPSKSMTMKKRDSLKKEKI